MSAQPETPPITPADELRDALIECGVDASHGPLVTRCLQDHIDAAGLHELLRLARGRGAKNPTGLLISWIQKGEALGVLQVAENGGPAAAPPPPPTGSHLSCVTAANPYGWHRPEIHRLEDHNLPGAWNGYRQTKNLTNEERLAAGAPDHRRRGCTREEVLGLYNRDKGAAPVMPTVDFDLNAVARAREVVGHA